MSNINNYKYNGMTIMAYLVIIMALIIFFICGVPNMFLLFNSDQSTQPAQYQLTQPAPYQYTEPSQ
jgi:flagellar basal body-associated protein FliL